MKQLVTFILLVISTVGSAQDFKTYTYFTNDSVKVELDLFLPKTVQNQRTPIVIFAHGGGFSMGSRTTGHTLASYLVSQNVACASISYSLYMKGKDFGCNGILEEKIKAIQIVSNQVWKATEFLIDNQVEFSIDPGKIILAGSSAGAEAVLHSVYWNRSKKNIYPIKLLESFMYAGVISGAGALSNLELVSKDTQIPLLAFHGSKDNLVPYATAPHHFCPENSTGYLMFYGSFTIAQKIKNLGGPVHLITYDKGGHQYCVELFYRNLEPVGQFVSNVVNDTFFSIFETEYIKSKK